MMSPDIELSLALKKKRCETNPRDNDTKNYVSETIISIGKRLMRIDWEPKQKMNRADCYIRTKRRKSLFFQCFMSKLDP